MSKIPSQYKNVEFKIVEVTPKWAAEMINELERRLATSKFRQRTPRWRAIARYAMDMRTGNFPVTHQGVAFDVEGNLIDGQNRLRAVAEAGVPVWMVVSTGWPVDPKTKYGTKTMDSIDLGVPRTVAHALQISHNYDYTAIELASIARNVIKFVLTNPNRREQRDEQMSTAQGLFVLEKLNYRGGAERFSAIVPNKKHRPAALSAVWSWYWQVYPEKAEAFATDFATLANLGQDHPALLLYRYVTTRSKRARRREPEFMGMVANAIHAYHNDLELKGGMRHNEDAHFWLLKQNWTHAQKITGLMVNEEAAEEPKKPQTGEAAAA